MAKVRVGVIGTGIGVTHVTVFGGLPEAELVAVCSAQRRRAEEVAERHGVPLATDDYRELLDAVDAVVIATPPPLHAPIGLEAIAAGKHVFCEKPLAASLAEARALRDAAQAAGVVNMLNFQMRLAPAYARAQELVQDGYLGELVMAEARITMNPIDYLRATWGSDSKATWFSDAAHSGGLLGSSAGPHLIDFMLWYGGPIVEVAARRLVSQPSVTLADGREVQVSAEDGFAILARYANGALATMRGVPIAHHRAEWRLELYGTAGTLLIDEGGPAGLVESTALVGATTDDEAPAPLMSPSQANTERDRSGLARRFVEACRVGGPSPAPNFDDGVAVQAIIEASMAAAKSGAWVAVEG